MATSSRSKDDDLFFEEIVNLSIEEVRKHSFYIYIYITTF